MNFIKNNKLIIYQVLVRLAGNTTPSPVPYGTSIQNGCGKFDDISTAFLNGINKLGATHIWLTGVLEHATCQDFSQYGIAADNPMVVKGLAGSPYAIRDYYDVNPDLANNIPGRMAEFDALIGRCHQEGLKPLIDFVPNHVARQYSADNNPKGIDSFGESDDLSRSFSPSSNFYYIPGKKLNIPEEILELPYVKNSGITSFDEDPAKATGNDKFEEHISFHDWYETVKLNYGVDYQDNGRKYFDPIPDTWNKMLDILLFWAGRNVSGFRCDMAEMVPIEFWQWVIPQVKQEFPEVIFIAEIYNPQVYHNFIYRGKFDYLYDKMGLYDTLRAIVEQKQPATAITSTWQDLEGLSPKMLRFMENHDEQRIASRHFGHTPLAGIAPMTVSATINKGPLMIYFGQETGEPADGAAGYSGDDGRTSIFDYWTVPTFQQWYNDGKCDGALLDDEQRKIYDFYTQLLKLCRHPVITRGNFYDLMWVNNSYNGFNDQHCYAFLRWDDDQVWLVVANFHPHTEIELNIHIPDHFSDLSGINPLSTGKVEPVFLSFNQQSSNLQTMANGLRVNISPQASMIISLG